MLVAVAVGAAAPSAAITATPAAAAAPTAAIAVVRHWSCRGPRRLLSSLSFPRRLRVRRQLLIVSEQAVLCWHPIIKLRFLLQLIYTNVADGLPQRAVGTS